jgi:hypothetical protein
MPGYAEKTGGLLCCQVPAPYLLGRHLAYQTAGWLLGYRADHRNLREELTKQLLLKDKGKLASLPNHLARLRQSIYLNTSTRTGCWRSNTRTTKTEILLFLNLEGFFWCVCLFISPSWFLWVFCLFVLGLFCLFLYCCFVLLVLLLWVSQY